MEEESCDRALAQIVNDETDATKQLVNPRAAKKASAFDLIALAKEVQKADTFVKATAGSKLQIIAEQIRFLQQQARSVLEQAHEDNYLHHAKCNLKKIPGKIYYLYKRRSGDVYFSILSPKEWGNSCPHEFIDSYRLEYDMSWTKEEYIDVRDQELSVIEGILNTGVPRLEFLVNAAHEKPAQLHHGHPIIEEQN